jgi:Restriction endonuclease
MDPDILELPVGYILSDIAGVIEPSLPVRREATRARGDYAPGPDHPITGPEMSAFLSEFVSTYPFIGGAVLTKPESHVVHIPAEYYDRILQRTLYDAGNNNWLGADGPYYVQIKKHLPEIHRRRSLDIPAGEKTNPIIEAPARIHAPSLNVILALFRHGIDLNTLNWRQLEEIIAELLKTEGYDVELGRGSKDGGADIIAHMSIPTIGYVRTIWQAKHLANGNKVGLSIVRELADVRNELQATKGFVVTSSFLTRGALERIRRDEYQLGKVERPELENWIRRTLGGQVA